MRDLLPIAGGKGGKRSSHCAEGEKLLREVGYRVPSSHKKKIPEKGGEEKRPELHQQKGKGKKRTAPPPAKEGEKEGESETRPSGVGEKEEPIPPQKKTVHREKKKGGG